MTQNLTINKDYIGFVSVSKDNKLAYHRQTIDNPYQELLGTLKDMAKNANQSVLDMQGYFVRDFPQATSPRGFNYCHPYHYEESFIKIPTYPKIVTFDEYQQELDTERKRLEDTKTKDIESALKKKQENIKESFLYNCTRYINAFCYTQTLKLLQKDKSNIIFSRETTGWTQYNHPIGNTTFQIRGNFGYGGSAYFYVNLNYKGIDLLPYSDIVKYYCVDTIQFMRYTRSYSLDRDSWNVALNFIVETGNLAESDEVTFIKQWIPNELKQMIEGLERMAENPNLCDKKNKIWENETPKRVITVRNSDNWSDKMYTLYPNEFNIVKQSEKLTTGLQLVQKLKLLLLIYPEVTDAIKRIETINLRLQPEWERVISKINQDIKTRQQEIDELITKQHQLEPICQDFEEKLNKKIESECKSLYEEISRIKQRIEEFTQNSNSADPDSDSDSMEKEITVLKESQSQKRQEIKEQFNIDNPDFPKINAQLIDLADRLSDKKTELKNRQELADMFATHLTVVKNYFRQTA